MQNKLSPVSYGICKVNSRTSHRLADLHIPVLCSVNHGSKAFGIKLLIGLKQILSISVWMR